MRLLNRSRRAGSPQEFTPRTKDTRRLDIHIMVRRLADIEPRPDHYATKDEYVAAVGIWDDVQRELNNGLREGDRRKRGQAPTTLSALLQREIARRPLAER